MKQEVMTLHEFIGSIGDRGLFLDTFTEMRELGIQYVLRIPNSLRYFPTRRKTGAWVEENCQGNVYFYNDYYLGFELNEDIVAFKMMWF